MEANLTPAQIAAQQALDQANADAAAANQPAAPTGVTPGETFSTAPEENVPAPAPEPAGPPPAPTPPPDQQIEETLSTLPDAQASGNDAVTALLHQLIEQQKQQRAEIQQQRAEIADLAQRRGVATPVVSVMLSDQEKYDNRIAEVRDFPFYCPGCGRLYKYERECTGPVVAPHRPIEVVSTDELTSGDAQTHTAAPNSE